MPSPCKADAENTPPTKQKTKVRGGIQGASRRRRARSAGSPNHPRYAVEQAKHRNSARQQQPLVASTERPLTSKDASVSDTASVSIATLSLPRRLCRPVFRDIEKETIASVAPELADTALHYIRQGLEYLGPLMLQVLAGVKVDLSPNVLPKELEAVVNDLSSDMPTHMLAVYSRHTPPNTKRHALLYPIHNIIIVTHCANVPILRKSDVVRPDKPGSTICMPVVPLCLPAPEVFSHLVTFLYTKRIDHLLATILPCPVPHALYLGDPKSRRVLNLLDRFANRLATNYSTQTLLKHTMTVNGLWRNVCALGIDDEKLWCALDVAWEVILTALATSTGQPL